MGKERYQCCLMPEDARGCEDKWECCGQAPEERGCQTVCNRCGVRWGHKPGCSWPEHDEENNEDHEDDDKKKKKEKEEVIVIKKDVVNVMNSIDESEEIAKVEYKNEFTERRQMSQSVHMSTDELL